MCGKNLLLHQERKLIGKSKHFETSLGYDIMYLLFTTTPKLLNLLGIRYQLSIVYYIPSCRLKRSTWFRMDFHFIPGFVLPKEKIFTTSPTQLYRWHIWHSCCSAYVTHKKPQYTCLAWLDRCRHEYGRGIC